MTSDQNDDQFNDDGFDPAEEDFADDQYNEDVAGDDSFADEDWDSYDESADAGDDDDAVDAPAKKKSSHFNKIVIGIAVLIGAGMLVMQMGQGPATDSAQNTQTPPEMAATQPVGSPDVMPAPAAAPPPVPLERTAENAAPQPAPAEGGFLSNPDNLAALERDIAKTYNETELVSTAHDDGSNAVIPPMPNSITPEPAPLAAEAPIRMPNVNEILKQPAPDSLTDALTDSPANSLDDPSANDDQLLAGQDQPVSPAAPAPVMTAPETAPLAATPDAALAVETMTDPGAVTALNEKLDLLLQRLDRMESDLSGLKESVAANDNAADLARLQNTVTALEQKMASQPTAPAKAAERQPEKRETPQRAEEPESVAPKPQILGGASTANPEAAAPAAASPVAKKAPQATTQWVLKGAQPGRAMVSRPGESDMRSVAVGDSLPGIGRITAISYENGRWLVQGTQGAVRQ